MTAVNATEGSAEGAGDSVVPEVSDRTRMVLRLIDEGASVGDALRIVLAGSREREELRGALWRFFGKYNLIRTAASGAVHGSRHPFPALTAALAAEFGGTPQHWRNLLRYGNHLGSAAYAAEPMAVPPAARKPGARKTAAG